MPQFKFCIADAFVDPEKPFSGNPAAVVILSKDNEISDHDKQNIATEFNLSETVFVSKLDDQENGFLIRWFTIQNEIELCGHAIMAASFVLFTQTHEYSELIDQDKPLKYRTHFGLSLKASYDGQHVTLTFPNYDPVAIDKTQCKWMSSLEKAFFGNDESGRVLDAHLGPNRYLLLRLSDDVDIGQLKPNFDELLKIDTGGSFMLAIVTQMANFELTGAHFTVRVFASWMGTNEDPVCGSAFTLLTPYWDRVYREQSKTEGKKNEFFQAKQMSRRGGLIMNKMANDGVIFGGLVKLFSTGHFTL